MTTSVDVTDKVHAMKLEVFVLFLSLFALSCSQGMVLIGKLDF